MEEEEEKESGTDEEEKFDKGSDCRGGEEVVVEVMGEVTVVVVRSLDPWEVGEDGCSGDVVGVVVGMVVK